MCSYVFLDVLSTGIFNKNVANGSCAIPSPYPEEGKISEDFEIFVPLGTRTKTFSFAVLTRGGVFSTTLNLNLCYIVVNLKP